MNIGQKIQQLFERSIYKDFQSYGKAMGISGDWLLDLRKKETLVQTDITRIIKIAEFHSISIDYLLKDDNGNWIIDIKEGLPSNDLCIILDSIKTELENDNPKFNGFALSEENCKMINDTIDIVKGLIQSRL